MPYVGAGVEATPGHWNTPGFPTRQEPALEADPRGYGKLALERNARREPQNSATHTLGWKENGDLSVLLPHPDPGHSEIDRVCKYVLCYGRKGADQPKIQRRIWKGAVLRVDERCGPNALRAKLLNAEVSRRMIIKDDRTVEAGDLPLWGLSGVFRKVSLSGARMIQATGETWARTTALDKYRARPIADGRLSLYDFPRMCDVPVSHRVIHSA